MSTAHPTVIGRNNQNHPLEGDGGPVSVPEVQAWLKDKLPEEVWRVAATACHEEGIDGQVLCTMSDAEMLQVPLYVLYIQPLCCLYIHSLCGL